MSMLVWNVEKPLYIGSVVSLAGTGNSTKICTYSDLRVSEK